MIPDPNSELLRSAARDFYCTMVMTQGNIEGVLSHDGSQSNDRGD